MFNTIFETKQGFIFFFNNGISFRPLLNNLQPIIKKIAQKCSHNNEFTKTLWNNIKQAQTNKH